MDVVLRHAIRKRMENLLDLWNLIGKARALATKPRRVGRAPARVSEISLHGCGAAPSLLRSGAPHGALRTMVAASFSRPRAPSSRLAPSGPLLLVLGTLLALQATWRCVPDAWLANEFYPAVYVRPVVAVLNQVPGFTAFSAQANVLVVDGTQLVIVRGCDGSEALLLFASGLAGLPLAWRRRGLALLRGVFAIYLLNLLRLATLAVCTHYAPGGFDLLHETLAPGVMLGAVLWLLARAGALHPGPAAAATGLPLR